MTEQTPTHVQGEKGLEGLEGGIKVGSRPQEGNRGGSQNVLEQRHKASMPPNQQLFATSFEPLLINGSLIRNTY